MKSLVCFICMVFYLNLVSAQDKPNILWITIEDTSPQFIGCYGNKDASTPVIDKMAEEGVRFTNAFSTGTVCSPSRSTIITGIPTYKMGTGHQRSKPPGRRSNDRPYWQRDRPQKRQAKQKRHGGGSYG